MSITTFVNLFVSLLIFLLKFWCDKYNIIEIMQCTYSACSVVHVHICCKLHLWNTHTSMNVTKGMSFVHHFWWDWWEGLLGCSFYTSSLLPLSEVSPETLQEEALLYRFHIEPTYANSSRVRCTVASLS